MITRERRRHELAVRRTTVQRVEWLNDSMVRVTVFGESLRGFTALGPNDHVKLFFPDPETGDLTTPEVTADGLKRPTDGLILSRDFTPLAFRENGTGGVPELDIDFVVHGDEAPATSFAAHVHPGLQLGIGGPRGSKLVPDGIARVVLIADETALPAFSRWLRMLPPDVKVTSIVQVHDEDAESYLTGEHRTRTNVEVLYREDGPGQLIEAVRSLGSIGDDTFVWAAGEANELVDVRRYFRRDLGLPKEQVEVEGYWKRGIVNLDHHAPLDPSDPD
ncbi:siderophore-interacting protein [Paramicrobacterium agarici]|uniref:NADPH-dependent ferric siderophore reductase n=1 Tax=Paramicrobacterium agarici TaxID=630514 RepID=A0A2A9DU21_9MICO|nr:siderophore-interacting protein [Microbacterium agarici]PFG29655.1 NADPH-dependent ferric siderophore reductase [Microbacterium agarici]TQO22678.1 NADPH-dependent ferric siderophore reductase [Microbacterium agarici]